MKVTIGSGIVSVSLGVSLLGIYVDRTLAVEVVPNLSPDGLSRAGFSNSTDSHPETTAPFLAQQYAQTQFLSPQQELLNKQPASQLPVILRPVSPNPDEPSLPPLPDFLLRQPADRAPGAILENTSDSTTVTIRSLTLDEAIAIAEQANPTLQSTRVDLKIAQTQLQQARAALYPSLGVDVGVSNTNPLPAVQGDILNGSTADVNTVQTTGSVGLKYEIYAGGGRSAQIRQQEQRVRFNELQVQRITRQIRLDVSNSYYDLQRSDAEVAIARADILEAQTTLRDADLMRQVGLAARFDVLQAQTSLTISESNLVRAIAQQKIARRALGELLSLPAEVEVRSAEEIAIRGRANASKFCKSCPARGSIFCNKTK